MRHRCTWCGLPIRPLAELTEIQELSPDGAHWGSSGAFFALFSLATRQNERGGDVLASALRTPIS